MDNLPTPPPRKSVSQQDGRGTPHSIDYETPTNGKHSTPAKSSTGHRSSSPRPHTASPSEFLLKTTAARVNDGEELSRRRSTLVVPTEPKPAVKRVVAPPSENLLKTTQARLSDKREWEAKQGVVKHEDDIWWEVRRPVEMAKHDHIKVESKLLDTTTACVYSARKKFPPRTTPDKLNIPGSTEKVVSPNGGCNPVPVKISKIDPSSALLRTTFNSQVKNVKNSLAPPPPPKPEIYTQNSGPKNVPSKLTSPTKNLQHSKWKSKEDLAKEQEAAEAAAAAAAKKVSKPSPSLVAYNKSLQNSARPKAEKPVGDERHLKWTNSYHKGLIPSVEEIQPLPAQKRTSFVGRASFLGSPTSAGANNNGNSGSNPNSPSNRNNNNRSSNSLNSSLESVGPYDPNEGVAPEDGAMQLDALDQNADVLDVNGNGVGEDNDNTAMDQEGVVDEDAERNAYRYDVGGDIAGAAQASEELESY